MQDGFHPVSLNLRGKVHAEARRGGNWEGNFTDSSMNLKSGRPHLSRFPAEGRGDRLVGDAG